VHILRHPPFAIRTFLCDLAVPTDGYQMKREQLIRQLNKNAKARGLNLEVDMARGKGRHCVVRVGGKFTVIKSGEITPLMEKIIRGQLGL
jgi:hypothetical protein